MKDYYHHIFYLWTINLWWLLYKRSQLYFTIAIWFKNHLSRITFFFTHFPLLVLDEGTGKKVEHDFIRFIYFPINGNRGTKTGKKSSERRKKNNEARKSSFHFKPRQFVKLHLRRQNKKKMWKIRTTTT